MNGYLIAEEGIFAGLIVRLESGEEWIIGRDPDVCYQVIEDPMVSRKHVIIRKEDDVFVAENLSAVNPATLNGTPIDEPVQLHEGDILSIGTIAFHFSEQDPAIISEDAPGEVERESKTPSTFPEEDRLDSFTFTGDKDARWLIKVTAGPNAGAEFTLTQGATYIIGKDPHVCDIVFQDMSVSRKHARITCAENNEIILEDLHSRNGLALNRKLVTKPTSLASQDVIVIGTTQLLVIDREATQDTLVSPAPVIHETSDEGAPKKRKSSWKDTVIPTRHLIAAGTFAVLLLFGVSGLISLFTSEPIEMEIISHTDVLKEKLIDFPHVQYSFNDRTGAIFLVGNVMTEVDHQEMMYMIKSIPFVRSLEDNVVIDELVWENTNAMLMKYPAWRGVYLTSSKPGSFVLKGYIPTNEEAGQLEDWMHSQFAYTNKLTNQVVVENTLNAQIQSLIATRGFSTVTLQITNGEVVLAGRVPTKQERAYNNLMQEIRTVDGVNDVKNFVIFSKNSKEYMDLTSNYSVTGTSKLGDVNQFVVINGRILSKGEEIDGMTIITIGNDAIFLEKDGLKYRINYNQQ